MRVTEVFTDTKLLNPSKSVMLMRSTKRKYPMVVTPLNPDREVKAAFSEIDRNPPMDPRPDSPVREEMNKFLDKIMSPPI